MADTYATEQACKEARVRLEMQGISVKDFALKHQLSPSTVYAVINGQKKCLRGEAHRAAVLLGIKQGEIPATTATQH
ncbi:gp16 family phage-associated protein [Pseudomonas sp. SORGH_AS199]|uniref:DNA-binding protein n=1 Tax=Pseudomonas sp. SORGH_AS_0199 TaxID=3041761 RepID=UPI00285B7089|nr:DNA-binding protein [Pseudomonas sp. SORGH_AS_0199]MDR6230462.1 gp16 family phage-associated protein [Pseudomonas sp. SORGH_AS_0199]